MNHFVVTIEERHGGYVSTITGVDCCTHHYVRAGLSAYTASCRALQLLMSYAKSSGLAGTIVAPPEVMQWIPEQLRSVPVPTRYLSDRLSPEIVELNAAATELLKELDGMQELFRDDESFCKAYRRLQAAIK